MRRIDMKGQRFGRLVVLSCAGQKYDGKTLWLCRCDCGRRTKIVRASLRRGLTRSCGCLSDENRLMGHQATHGHCRAIYPQQQSPTYVSWQAMKARCLNKRHRHYSRYGGRGIRICRRWRKFGNFLADMGMRPKGKTLDRFPDNDGHYKPSNCRWATPKEQRARRY